jgi:DnaK suppressor protein
MPASKKKEVTILIHGVKPYVEKKGEKYMNKKQMEHFRAVLLGWRQELLVEVSKTVHSMQDETINHPDPTDRASQETDMSLELRSRDRERKLIKKIDEALAKIDGADYGYCETCGVEIGVQRLEARPTATLCIDCKTLDEIREKKMG